MTPFDLEKAVAAWRQNLERSGAFVPDDVDELEAHLRDHIEALSRQGHTPKHALDAALKRLGPRSGIESEFRKVRFVRRKRRSSVTNWLAREWELHKNYFVTALRNVRRNKVYALINTVGLAVGMAACLLIGLYVRDELSFDRFHEKADRIAALGDESHGRRSMVTPYPLASTLEAELPEVELGVRVLSRNLEIRPESESASFKLDVAFTEPSFLDVFSFPLLSGASSGGLADPNSAILTRETALRLFGTEDVVGRTVLLEYGGKERPLTISDVAEDPPLQSTMQFDALCPLSSIHDQLPTEGSWGALMYRTFVLLENPADLDGLDERINRVVDLRDTSEPHEMTPTYISEPLTELYLSEMYPSAGLRGSKRYVYIFASIALLVLLIAAINYVNLSTALATRRMREVGVRKTLGAERFQLVRQFTAESVLLSTAALALALMLSLALLSGFNHLFSSELTMKPDLLMLGLCLGVLAVGIISGGYPAFILSRLRPTSVFSGKNRLGGRGRLRQTLVVFQFGITVALFVGTAVIFRQLEYVQTKNLGFNGEQVVAVRLPAALFWESRDVVRQEAAGHPAVLAATVANGAPSSFFVKLGFRKDEITPEHDGNDDIMWFKPAIVDHEFVPTLGLRLLAGRNFSIERNSDESLGYILNEMAARNLGWSAAEAIGKPFTLGGDAPGDDADDNDGMSNSALTYGKVIGVVEDFHISSLKEEIDPVILLQREEKSWSSPPLLLAKLSPDGIPAAIDHLERIFNRMAPDESFTFEFLDERFDAMYREEERLGKIFSSFAALAIILACLGLFGLSAYAAQSRTKEIGIRKVMGASAGDVVSLLTRKFLVLVMIGFAIAAPTSYYLMNRWLEDFVYRIDVSILLIFLVGLATITLALVTVGFQSAKAAYANPAESLRYE